MKLFLLFVLLITLSNTSFSQCKLKEVGAKSGLVGFSKQQLSESLVANSKGQVYLLYIDKEQNNKTSVKTYEDTSWVYAGNAGFSLPKISAAAIAIDSNNNIYVCYVDSLQPKIGYLTMLNGNSWLTFDTIDFLDGKDISLIPELIEENWLSMSFDHNDTLHIAFSYQGLLGLSQISGIMAWKRNGNIWENTYAAEGGYNEQAAGSAYTSASLLKGDDDSLYLSHYQEINSVASSYVVHKFSGSSWVQLGDPQTVHSSGSEIPSLAVDKNGVVYLSTPYWYCLHVRKYEANSWLDVGGANTTCNKIGSYYGGGEIVVNSSGQIFASANESKQVLFMYDKVDWSILQTSYSPSSFPHNRVNVCIDKNNYVYMALRRNNDSLQAYKYDCSKGLTESIIKQKFEIYPNPLSTQSTIILPQFLHAATLTIIDLNGREIKNISFSGNSTVIEKDNLFSGVYFVKITCDEMLFEMQKIMVK